LLVSKLPSLVLACGRPFRELRRVAKRTKSLMPGFIKSQLATLKDQAPSRARWIHEINMTTTALSRGAAKIFTRNGHDWTKRFARIASAFKLKSHHLRWRGGCGP